MKWDHPCIFIYLKCTPKSSFYLRSVIRKNPCTFPVFSVLLNFDDYMFSLSMQHGQKCRFRKLNQCFFTLLLQTLPTVKKLLFYMSRNSWIHRAWERKKKWIPQISVQAQIDGLAFQFLHSKKTVCAHRTIQRGFTYRKLEVFRFSSQSLP
jgi:hypothetical protein